MSLQGFKIENSIIKYDYEALQNKPTIDNTLSVSRAIADAKATGDAIKEGTGNALASIAPIYSNTATYAVGDYVIYDGQLYKCTTAITTGETWTAAKWVAAKIASDVISLKEDLNSKIDIITVNDDEIVIGTQNHTFVLGNHKIIFHPDGTVTWEEV